MWSRFIVIIFLLMMIHTEAATNFFVVLSDIHYDPTYASSNPESCSQTVSPDEKGLYGNYHCDTPLTLLNKAMSGLTQLSQGAQFIVWGGDTLHHIMDGNTVLQPSTVQSIRQQVTKAIADAVGSVPVLPVLGDYDILPLQQIPPDNANGFYITMYELWKDWLPDILSSDGLFFASNGFYTSNVETGANIKAIIVNSNLYLPENGQVKNLIDPGYQLSILELTLKEARLTQKKVIIFTHIPLGVSADTGTGFMTNDFNNKLVTIITAMSDVIIGVFAFHSHKDTFQLIRGTDGLVAAVQFTSPSITPRETLNPSLRKVIYDNQTMSIVDIEQYSLVLPPAGDIIDPHWMLEYTFKETYGYGGLPKETLGVDTMTSIAQSLEEELYFNRYYKFQNRLAGNRTCDCDCNYRQLCAVHNVVFAEFDKCYRDKKAAMCRSGSTLSAVSSFILTIVCTFLAILTI